MEKDGRHLPARSRSPGQPGTPPCYPRPKARRPRPAAPAATPRLGRPTPAPPALIAGAYRCNQQAPVTCLAPQRPSPARGHGLQNCHCITCITGARHCWSISWPARISRWGLFRYGCPACPEQGTCCQMEFTALPYGAATTPAVRCSVRPRATILSAGQRCQWRGPPWGGCAGCGVWFVIIAGRHFYRPAPFAPADRCHWSNSGYSSRRGLRFRYSLLGWCGEFSPQAILNQNVGVPVRTQ